MLLGITGANQGFDPFRSVFAVDNHLLFWEVPFKFRLSTGVEG